MLEEERRIISNRFIGKDWIDHLDVTIAMTDGAAARMYVIIIYLYLFMN